MMLLFPDGRKANVWLHTLPDALYEPSEMLECSVLRPPHAKARLSKAALEMSIPKGPVSPYGLLGAEFTPDASGTLRLRVGVNPEQARPYLEALALPSDTVRVGLTKEIAGGLLSLFMNGASPAALTSGEITIRHAAMGAVNSSPAIFRYLGILLIRLLSLADDPTPDEVRANLSMPFKPDSAERRNDIYCPRPED